MTSIYLVAKKLKGGVPNTLIFNETRTVRTFENIAFLNQFTERYPNRVIFANYNTLLQFKIMLVAKTLVCPDSSYSKMCALLSDATTVYKNTTHLLIKQLVTFRCK